MWVEILQFTLLGLGLGSIYALTAQGVVLVYRGSGVLNFAQGSFALVAAIAYYEARNAGWPAWAAVSGALVVAAMAGALTQLLVMRPLRAASALTRMVATLGVLTVVQGGTVLLYGDKLRIVRGFLPTGTVSVTDGVTIGQDRLWILAISVVISIVLWAVYRWTAFGRATTAVTESRRVAASAGISPQRVEVANWTLGAALAGVAGVLLVPIANLSIITLSLLVLPALAAALLGGFRSFGLTLVGGLLIGIGEAQLTRWVTAPGWARAVPFIIIILVLVVRGRSLESRSKVRERLPAVGDGRVSPKIAGPAIVAATIAILLVDAGWNLAITATLTTGVIGLSLVVITGYTGQLSLAQFAFAGFGALVASRLSDAFGWPFLLVAMVGVLAAIPVGLLVGLPALRTRGVSLAVVTIGLASVVESVILGNPDFTGGLLGTQVEPPDLFGLDVDPIVFPERYSLVCLAAFVILAVLVGNLRRGRSGRRFIAVRGNEDAAAALGIGVVGVKLYAFALAAAIAAVGGILFAFTNRQVLFNQFSLLASINLVILAVLGGIGFLIGPLQGAWILAVGGVSSYAMQQVFGGAVEDYLLLFGGTALIIQMIVQPDGITGDLAQRRARRPGPGRARPDTLNAVLSVPERVRPLGISIDRLSVRFGAVRAVADVSFVVEPGEIVGLIGPNGAGKTTVIDAISGRTRRYSGAVRLGGAAVDRKSAVRRARAGIGRSFQSLELFEDMTVLDNLRTASERRDALAFVTDLVRPGHPPLAPVAQAAIREFKLELDLARKPAELSYGRRRLVGIARAVAAQPSVLLLDEPAAGLDRTETAELGRLVKRLAADWGIAVLLVEHDIAIVTSVCDRVVVLNFGSKLSEGTPLEVRSEPAVKAAYLGEAVERVSPVRS